MDPSQPLAVCIDIGGTKAFIGIVDQSGSILARERYAPSLSMSPQELVQALAERSRALAGREQIAWERIAGVGYSTAGMMDVETGIIFASPNQGDWRNVPYKALLEKSFSLPVWIEMDANAAALGEAWLGAGAGARYFIHVIIGTGIGAGILLGGEVMRGWRGTAGEFGHTIIDINGPLCNCGRNGCLESLASGPAIALRARAAVKTEPGSLLTSLAGENEISTVIVFQAARAGDKTALAVLDETIHFLAVGLSNLIHLLNPQVIALGGGVAIGGASLLVEPLREKTYALCGSWVDIQGTKICIAQLGENAGMLGAARLVWQKLSGIS